MKALKVTREFVERHKSLIAKARTTQPKSLKEGTPRRIVADLARVECGYAAGIRPIHIWGAVINKYFDLYNE